MDPSGWIGDKGYVGRGMITPHKKPPTENPMSLSGGQKQRLVIAAAQMVDKEVYVFDEPSSGLDYRHLRSTARTIRDLAGSGKVVVVVTHDEELLDACADSVVQMRPLAPA